jgi:hypothetical protein
VAAGGSYAESILDAIENSKCFVLVYTQNANVSAHVLREVERALKFGLNIIPVRFDGSNVGKSLDYLLATVHWLSALSPPLDRAVDQAAARIEEAVQPRQAGAILPRTNLPSLQMEPERGLRPRPSRTSIVALAGLLLVAGVAGFFAFKLRKTETPPAVTNRPAAVSPSATVEPVARADASSTPPFAVTSIRPGQRFNSFPEDILDRDDQILLGVKETLAFTTDSGADKKIQFPISGIAKPAELIFDRIAPNYPFALAVRFPDYRRTSYIDPSAQCPEAFADDDLKDDWKLVATVYDIEQDGIPELLVALNRWSAKNKFWNGSVVLLVYTFHPPSNPADLDRSENWSFAGKATGQYLVYLEDEKIILPIGSRAGNLFLLKDGKLVDAGGVARDNNGRYKAD